MKLLSAAAAAGALASAPLLANAQTFRLELSRADLLGSSGDKAVDRWANQVADEVCGRDDFPQPIELLHARKACRAEMIARAKASRQQQAALVSQQIQYGATTPATGDVSAQPGDTAPQP
jgi:UrcA family protein